MANSLEDWKAKITKATTVQKSAEVCINGFGARMQAAVDAALANGATAEELAPVTDEIALLDTESDNLQTAIAANTVAE